MSTGFGSRCPFDVSPRVAGVSLAKRSVHGCSVVTNSERALQRDVEASMFTVIKRMSGHVMFLFEVDILYSNVEPLFL